MTNILANLVFDEYDSLIQATHGWDLDFIQLDKGQFHGRLFQFLSGNHLFAHAQFSRKLYQRGAAPNGMWTFAILGSPEINLEFKRHHVDDAYIMIYPPGSDVSAISKSHFDILIFSASEEYLEQLSEKKQLPGFRRKFEGVDVIACFKKDIDKLRHLLIQLFNTVNKYSNGLWTIFDQTYVTDLVFESLFRGLYNEHIVTPAPMYGSRLGDLAFRQAIECINMFSMENLTVRGLVNSTGISARTLEYVFIERLGISPKEYIRTFRLNQVKRQIKESAYSTKKISTIANECGFWHMGQFAKDYKTLFGELPSETRLKMPDEAILKHK